MINHVRTLLLNRSREGSGLDTPGEEYIPADFVPRQADSMIARIQRILFGTQPDRIYLNYRARQIMQLLHATPLGRDVTLDDRRITYLPFNAELFTEAFGTTVTRLEGPAAVVTVGGVYEADYSLGRTEAIWDVEVTAPGVANVDLRRGSLISQQLSFDASSPVILPDSQLLLYMADAVTGFKARVRSVARPTLDLSRLMTRVTQTLSSSDIVKLFPPGAAEPVSEWEEVWRTHPATAWRFAALLLAIARHTSTLPQEAA